MCAFIVDRFGYHAINQMIAAFRARKTQVEVLREVLGVSPDEFNSQFRAWSREDARSWGLDLTPIGDVHTLKSVFKKQSTASNLARLAMAEFHTDEVHEAVKHARQAVEMDPQSRPALATIGQIMWQIREESGEEGRAQVDPYLAPLMIRLNKLEHSHWIAPKVLATIALERDDYAAAEIFFAKLKRLLPLDPTADRGLAGISLAEGNYDAAIGHLIEVARLDTDDPDIPATLGTIFAQRGRIGESRHWFMQSIFIDAFNLRTHEALAEVCEQIDDQSCIAREHNALYLLDSDDVSHAKRAIDAYVASGEFESARALAERVRSEHPESNLPTIPADEE